MVSIRTRLFFLFWILLSVFPVAVQPIFAQKGKFTVVIDPGHGGKDPGAIGSTAKEKDIVLSVGLKLGKLIEQNFSDVEVIFTRKNDRFVELNKRAEIANKAHADLFISLHCNALDRRRTSPQGVETFVLGLHRSKDNLDVAKAENSVIMYEEDYSVKYEGFNPNEPESYIIFEFMANEFLDRSVYFATMVQHQLVTHSKRSNRNVRQAGFLVLREVAMPSVLVELGYVSNKDEERYLKSEKGQMSLAESIFNGFREYKREHDKKSYVFTGSSASQSVSGNRDLSASVEKSKAEYRIQFLTASRKFNEGASVFKGLDPVDCYVDGALVKYTYGRANSQSEAEALLRKVRKKFKDAFIVVFVDEKRVK